MFCLPFIWLITQQIFALMTKSCLEIYVSTLSAKKHGHTLRSHDVRGKCDIRKLASLSAALKQPGMNSGHSGSPSMLVSMTPCKFFHSP